MDVAEAFDTVFLSTPSARRATPECYSRKADLQISIHALREEGDTSVFSIWSGQWISIHALREEGDLFRLYPTGHP